MTGASPNFLTVKHCSHLCTQAADYLALLVEKCSSWCARQAGRQAQALKEKTHLEGGGGTPDRHGA